MGWGHSLAWAVSRLLPCFACLGTGSGSPLLPTPSVFSNPTTLSPGAPTALAPSTRPGPGWPLCPRGQLSRPREKDCGGKGGRVAVDYWGW
ncbi:hypothetical protein M758_1G132900 [Ceratodon purpureus]|nr:hypothetical protein M758_1G132900 [Ceratodon purpureus]